MRFHQTTNWKWNSHSPCRFSHRQRTAGPTHAQQDDVELQHSRLVRRRTCTHIVNEPNTNGRNKNKPLFDEILCGSIYREQCSKWICPFRVQQCFRDWVQCFVGCVLEEAQANATKHSLQVHTSVLNIFVKIQRIKKNYAVKNYFSSLENHRDPSCLRTRKNR